MLKDRRHESAGFFYVTKDVADSRRQLFYRFFSLEEDFKHLSNLTPMEYWNPRKEETTRIPMQEHRFVLLVEKEQDRVVDQDWFCCSDEVCRDELEVCVSKNKKYGSNAYMITIRWSGEVDPQPINCRYIYLKNIYKKEKFYFLQEVISPLKADGRRPMDQYVFELPVGETLDDYTVYVEPLVKKQYRVSIDM